MYNLLHFVSNFSIIRDVRAPDGFALQNLPHIPYLSEMHTRVFGLSDFRIRETPVDILP